MLPSPGAGLDLAAFLQDCGTLYLIAESEHDESPLAPLFACLAGEIHHAAALLGSRMPDGRLDPPLLMALDEVTQICPVPVPSWLADSGGKGIQIIAVAHGEAQLRSPVEGGRRPHDHGHRRREGVPAGRHRPGHAGHGVQAVRAGRLPRARRRAGLPARRDDAGHDPPAAARAGPGPPRRAGAR